MTAEREGLEAMGRKPALRFRVPDDQTVVVNDLVRGDVAFETSTLGDYIIVKSDGIPVYNFACVVDDTLMEITHVIRGRNFPNTAAPVAYDALGLERRKFAHVSLIFWRDVQNEQTPWEHLGVATGSG